MAEPIGALWVARQITRDIDLAVGEPLSLLRGEPDY